MAGLARSRPPAFALQVMPTDQEIDECLATIAWPKVGRDAAPPDLVAVHARQDEMRARLAAQEAAEEAAVSELKHARPKHHREPRPKPTFSEWFLTRSPQVRGIVLGLLRGRDIPTLATDWYVTVGRVRQITDALSVHLPSTADEFDRELTIIEQRL